MVCFIISLAFGNQWVDFGILCFIFILYLFFFNFGEFSVLIIFILLTVNVILADYLIVYLIPISDSFSISYHQLVIYSIGEFIWAFTTSALFGVAMFIILYFLLRNYLFGFSNLGFYNYLISYVKLVSYLFVNGSFKEFNVYYYFINLFSIHWLLWFINSFNQLLSSLIVLLLIC